MRHGFVALALALLPLAALAADPPKADPKATFVGTWDTTYGTMTLAEKDGKVSGKYGGGNTLTGTVKDGKYTFTYDEGFAKGEGEFTLSEDGKSFTGKWRQTGAKDWVDWTGKRVKDAGPKADPKADPKATFAGTWDTTFGAMTLTEKGGKVSGTYAAVNTITGTVKGNKLTFTYTEGKVTGEGEFELAADGQSFTGKWRETGQKSWLDWAGKRTEPEKKPK